MGPELLARLEEARVRYEGLQARRHDLHESLPPTLDEAFARIARSRERRALPLGGAAEHWTQASAEPEARTHRRG
jgi:hypothetical protein